MKRISIVVGACVLFVAALENPAHAACTSTQAAQYNLAVRAMHMAADVSKQVAGNRADNTVNALMDLVESIDKQLAASSCGK